MTDTIAAISSATAPSARIILRLSGPASMPLAQKLGATDAGRSSASRQTLHLRNLSFPAWIYRFAAPSSYSGEDLIEFHIPGNPLLARLLLDCLLHHGARQADPGEFTARAFFHGKLDLSQAEGVAAMISAQNQNQLDAARRLLAGELAQRLKPIMGSLANSLALVEAGIDFADEGIEFLPAPDLAANLANLSADLDRLKAHSGRFDRLTHEPVIVLAGRPNAGKSTLANTLAGKPRSIVSPVAGTTRDALSVNITLPRGVARLIDIAGVESADDSPSGTIDQQMQQIAQREMARADVLVLVREASDHRPDIPLPRPPDLRIASKTDLPQVGDVTHSIPVSALTGAGMDALRDQLDLLAFGSDSPSQSLALTARHLRAIDTARDALQRAASVLNSPELTAAEIRHALDHLGTILGIVSPDDILGKIFSSFCIGK